jgi:multidrug efflux pump subunit AcrB
MAEQEKQFSIPAQHEAHSLGIAGRTARLFITSPVTPMILIVSLLVGLIGLFFTPRQEDPQISVPMIDVFVQYPGASAEQVSTLVTEPLERLLLEIPGVKHTYTATERGSAMVTVRFKVGQDMGQSIVKVRDKILSNMDKMPPNVLQPLIKPVGIDDVPIVTLTLWSNDVDDGALRLLALDLLQNIGEVDGVGKGFVVGGREEQVRVEVMPERLSGFGISLQQVAQTINTANSEQTAGDVESGGLSFSVRTGSFLTNAKEIGRLVIGIRNGSPVYVRDVANVSQQPAEPSHMAAFYTGPGYEGNKEGAQGAPAVTVAIAKKKGTNGVTISQRILKKVASLKGELIPSNVHVEVTRDYGKSANDKVNELLEAMLEASVIVAVLCMIGLGIRASIVVLAVIPVVILLTIWWAMMVDYTIDRVSLFALIFSIGILVDDAAVVVENIFRRWLEAGKTSVSIAIDAVREVGNPTILATFTIISALLPMGWVSGLMGPYMRPIPVLGASAMFFSLLAAFIFTPWMTVKMAPKQAALRRAEEKEKKTHQRISKFYRPIIMPLIRNRKLGLMFLFGIIGTTAALCITFYTQTVAVKMLPFDNKPEFSVVVNMPEGTAMPDTANVVMTLAEAVRKLPEVTAVTTYAGTAQPFNFNGMVRHYYLRQRPWEGDLLVMLKDKHERERGSHEIAVAARHLLKPLADKLGAKIAVVEMPPGPPVLQTVVAEVYGPDAETRRQVAADLTKMFDSTPGVVDVDNYMAEPHEYWRFEVDTEKAVRRGISVDTINGSLAMAMGGYKLGDIKRGTVLEPTYIVMQVPLAIRSQVARLGDLPIPTNDGHTVPLSELGEFKKGVEDPLRYTIDLKPIEYVVAEMEGRLGAPIYGMLDIEDKVKQYVTPDGVHMDTMPKTILGKPGDWTFLGTRAAPEEQSGYEWTGEWTVTYETFRDMGGAFMAALVLIYGLIVWEFRNFALAGLIMSPIPVTMMGIIPGHWLLGAEFTATSMIGMIALGGIIVRQSILIVEFVKNEVAKGKDVAEAAVHGVEMRMRPIIITTLTVMGGSFAILNDPIFNGMAISLLFGAGVATAMALLIIPLGCISARKQFYVQTNDDGSVSISPAFGMVEQADSGQSTGGSGTPLLMRIWGGIFSLFSWLFIVIKAMFTLIGMGLSGLGGKRGKGTPPPPRPSAPGGGTPPPRQPPPGGGTPPPPREAPPTAKGTPPPPREAPSTAKGTPPPPREAPSTAKGTPPPPREAPPAVKGTPPPPREVPTETIQATAESDVAAAHGTPPPSSEVPQSAQVDVYTSATASGDTTVATGDDDEDPDGTIGKKRRGIRLKQDLN